MNKTIRRRLAEVEARTDLTVVHACDTCRCYPGIVIMDGNGAMSRPEVCPDCGRNVPIVQLIQVAGAPAGLGEG